MVTYIGREEFKNGKGYKIKCPGTYKLAENISFCPKKNKKTAILIDSDNVILDLNGKELRQSSHSKYSQIDGITIKTGHKHVTILGSYGSVKNFSQRGIYLQGGNDFVTLGDNTLLTVTGCGYGTPVTLQDKTENIIQVGIQLGDMVFFAKAGFGSYNGLVNNLRVTNAVSTKNNTGVSLGEGAEYFFENCSFSGNYDNRIANNSLATLGGFIVENSVVTYGLIYLSNPDLNTPDLSSFGVQNVVFKGCRFNDNFADGQKATNGIVPNGAYCDSFFMGANTRGLKIENCQFNSNLTKLNPSGFVNQTRGCVISSGASTVIENSEFSNNEGGRLVNGLNITGLIAGTEITSRNNFPARSTTIRDCVASRNRGVTTTINPDLEQIEVIGFSLRYPFGLTLENCTSEDNTATLDVDVPINTFCDGILIFSDIRFSEKFANNIKINNCKSSRNRVVKGKKGSSSGLRILDDLCENIVIENSVFTGNWRLFEDGELPSDYEIFGVGIDLFNESVNTGPSFVSVTNNIVQSNNDFGITTNLDYTNIQNNRILNHSVGIDLSDTCSSSVLNNTVLTTAVGISDSGDPSTSLVGENKVFNSVVPFNVFYGPGETDPVPYVEGTLNSYPPLSTVSCSNVSISGSICSQNSEVKSAAKPFKSSRARSTKQEDKKHALEQIKRLHKLKNELKSRK